MITKVVLQPLLMPSSGKSTTEPRNGPTMHCCKSDLKRNLLIQVQAKPNWFWDRSSGCSCSSLCRLILFWHPPVSACIAHGAEKTPQLQQLHLPGGAQEVSQRGNMVPQKSTASPQTRTWLWLDVKPNAEGKDRQVSDLLSDSPVLSCTRVCVVTHSLNHQHYHTVQAELTSSSLKVMELWPFPAAEKVSYGLL